MKHAPTNINVTVTVSCNFCRMIRTYRSHLRLLRVPVIILFVTISLLLVRTTVFWRVLTTVHYTFDCLVFWLCPSPSIPNRSVSETGSVSIHTQAVGDIPLTLIRLDGEWEHFFFYLRIVFTSGEALVEFLVTMGNRGRIKSVMINHYFSSNDQVCPSWQMTAASGFLLAQHLAKLNETS